MKRVIGLLSLSLLLLTLVICFAGCGILDKITGTPEANEPHVHTWSEWEAINNGFCQDLIFERVCLECDQHDTKHGRDADHDWQTNTIPSTCKEQGREESICKNCGALGDVEFLPYADHLFPENYSTNEYYHWKECSECGQIENSEYSPHVISNNGKCTICGHLAEDPNNPLAGVYNITIWMPEDPTVYGQVILEQVQCQINDFMAANPGIIINANVSLVYEPDAASMIVGDVNTAPDIFCFPQYQLPHLIQVSALAAPGGTIAEQIKANNDASSVLAASSNGVIYAHPMSSDNGYYLYYDKSIVTDPSSLEAIIADCEKAYDAGKEHRLFRFGLENAWYSVSFFFGAGCHSEWTMNADGDFTGVDDNFNSAQGLVAMKGMQKLAHSRVYDPNSDMFTNAAAIVTGIWNADIAEAHFGENLGVCKLPSFTVDGETYQLGSFSGNRLMGVKPQSDSKKGMVLQLLAQYLTSEKCQLERYDTLGYGPSNLKAQASEAVQSNVHLAALMAQNAHAIPQGMTHGAWWDTAAKLGRGIKDASTEKDLWQLLETYEYEVNNIIPEEQKYKDAWSVIGDIEDSAWATDFMMNKISDGVWESDVLYLVAGRELMLRKGRSWGVVIGAGGRLNTSSFYPKNIVVETTGSFVIRLEWDGVSDTAKVIFIPA